jgi:hypothetical protein
MKKSDLTKVKDLLYRLEHRTEMYIDVVDTSTYYGIVSFVTGFEQAIYLLDNNNELFGKLFYTWFYDKINKESNLVYSAYIFRYLANNEEEQAKKLLFSYWNAYLDELINQASD